MTFEIALCIICAVASVLCYIYLVATGEMWHGINWDYIFRRIRSFIRKLRHHHK